MKNKIISGVILLACLLMGFIVYNAVELYDETTDVGWALEAKRNNFLAAELLLKKLGAVVESSDSALAMHKLESVDHLLITNSALVLNAAVTDRLMHWVSNGGHLVVGANENRGLLLERLGVDYQPVDYAYADGEQPLNGDFGWQSSGKTSPLEKALLEKSRHDKHKKDCDDCKTKEENIQSPPEKKFSDILKEANRKISNERRNTAQAPPIVLASEGAVAEEIVPPRRITHVTLTNSDNEIPLAFSPRAIISHPSNAHPDAEEAYKPFYSAGTEAGESFMQFSVGKGEITVVSDASIWDSHQLGRLDHGLLLHALGFDQGRCLLLYGTAMPSIMRLAWTKFPEFISVAAAAIVFWLWRKAVRVGPVRVVDPSIRRSIIDAIQGLANYKHKRRRFALIVEPVIADIFRLANRQIAGFAQADSAAKIALISAHSGLPLNSVQQALSVATITGDGTLQTVLQLLQTIRKSL